MFTLLCGAFLRVAMHGLATPGWAFRPYAKQTKDACAEALYPHNILYGWEMLGNAGFCLPLPCNAIQGLYTRPCRVKRRSVEQRNAEQSKEFEMKPGDRVTTVDGREYDLTARASRGGYGWN